MTQFTISVEDPVAEALKARAVREGKSVESVVSDELTKMVKGSSFSDLWKLLDADGAKPLGEPFRRDMAYEGKRFEPR